MNDVIPWMKLGQKLEEYRGRLADVVGEESIRFIEIFAAPRKQTPPREYRQPIVYSLQWGDASQHAPFVGPLNQVPEDTSFPDTEVSQTFEELRQDLQKSFGRESEYGLVTGLRIFVTSPNPGPEYYGKMCLFSWAHGEFREYHEMEYKGEQITWWGDPCDPFG